MAELKLSRYDQHVELPEVQVEGQKKIFNARVLIVGAGGLGCPVGQYLTGAGVGTIGIVDGDVIEETNLHRQILYRESDIGRYKAQVARERLSDIACNQKINAYPYFLDSKNIVALVKEYDLVVDATDNHVVRLLINETCLALNKPWVYGALYRFEGQTAVFAGREGPCFTCLFPSVNKNSALPTCKTSGVLSPVPGVIGSLQALEALKVILDLNNPANTRLKITDFLYNDARQIRIVRNPECIACRQYHREQSS